MKKTILLYGLTHFRWIHLWLVLFLLLAGCSSPALPDVATEVPPTTTPNRTPTVLPSPLPTSIPETATPTAQPASICSPLQNWSLAELTENITNPYLPPKFGSDDPHQAVDLTVFDASRTLSLQGEPVHAVLAGVVAGIVQNRFPYGNAVLIETHLEDLPPEWISQMSIPDPLPAPEVQSALTCPQSDMLSLVTSGEQSVYLLYAHLQNAPGFVPGDAIQCGEVIGNVGGTGNALNPHLHLELRIGPSDSVFRSMAHYDPSASSEEMANYCAWRIGGSFYRMDPLLLLSHLP